MDETTIAVQTKKHHEESKITTLMDLTRDDAQEIELMVGIAKHDNDSSIDPTTYAIKEDTGVEHESDNGENIEKTETKGVDQEPSSLSQDLEEQHEKSQSSLYIDEK